MSAGETRESSVAKPGQGDRVFLAFLGRARRSEDAPELSAKSDSKNDVIGLLLIVLCGGMIAVVLWRLFFGAF